MADDGGNIGTTQIIVDANTAKADVNAAPLRSTSQEFTKLGTAADAAGTQVAAAGDKVDRTAKLQAQAMDKARRAWQQEILVQERAAASATETARAQEMAALKADILARSEAGAAEATGAFGNSAASAQIKIGLLDNAIRGQATRSLADMIHAVSGAGMVMKLLPIAATVAGVVVLGHVVSEAAQKFQEWRDSQKLLKEGMETFQTGLLGVTNGLEDKLLQVQIEADDLNNNHLDALQKRLELINHQSLGDLAAQFREIEEIADRALTMKQFAGKWYTGDSGSVGAKDALDEFGAQYGLLLGTGDTKGASDLLAGTLAQAREVAALQAKLQSTPQHLPGAAVAAGGATAAETENPAYTQIRQRLFKLSGLGVSSQDVKSQEDLIKVLQTTSDAAKLQGQLNQAAAKGAVSNEDKRGGKSRLEAAKQGLAALEAQHQMSYDEQAAYWQKLADGARHGSTFYKAALLEANKSRAEAQKEFQKNAISELLSDAVRDRNNSQRINEEVEAGWTELQRINEESRKEGDRNAVASYRTAVENLRNSEKLDEERLRLAQKGGDVSPSDAAQQMQEIHRRAFSEWSKLTAQFSAEHPFVTIPGVPQMRGQYATQSLQDADAVETATVFGQLRDSITSVTERFTNLGAVIGDQFTRDLGTFNETLVKALSTPHSQLQGRHIFGNAGAQMFRGASGAALEFGEGRLMQGLGLAHGKMFTPGNPGHVLVDNFKSAASNVMNTTGASGLLGMMNNSNFLGGLFGGRIFGPGGIFDKGAGVASSMSKASSAGSTASSVVGSLLHLLPGFASGGTVYGNMPSLVGERGPEVFMPASSGRIIPNDRAFGSSFHFSPSIDARGSTDTAATEASVHRAMASWMPHVKDMAIAAVRDHNSRVPSRRRL